MKSSYPPDTCGWLYPFTKYEHILGSQADKFTGRFPWFQKKIPKHFRVFVHRSFKILSTVMENIPIVPEDCDLDQNLLTKLKDIKEKLADKSCCINSVRRQSLVERVHEYEERMELLMHLQNMRKEDCELRATMANLKEQEEYENKKICDARSSLANTVKENRVVCMKSKNRFGMVELLKSLRASNDLARSEDLLERLFHALEKLKRLETLHCFLTNTYPRAPGETNDKDKEEVLSTVETIKRFIADEVAVRSEFLKTIRQILDFAYSEVFEDLLIMWRVVVMELLREVPDCNFICAFEAVLGKAIRGKRDKYVHCINKNVRRMLCLFNKMENVYNEELQKCNQSNTTSVVLSAHIPDISTQMAGVPLNSLFSDNLQFYDALMVLYNCILKYCPPTECS